MLFYPYFLPILELHNFQLLRLEIFLFRFLHLIKHWAKPTTLSLISDVLSDLTRTRSDLIVENALLRQQLIVLN